MTHFGKSSTNAMRFDKLEVSNNVFRGVNSEQDMLKQVTNTKKRKVKSNSYSR
jgi:hypothetical protein